MNRQLPVNTIGSKYAMKKYRMFLGFDFWIMVVTTMETVLIKVKSSTIIYLGMTLPFPNEHSQHISLKSGCINEKIV